MAAPRVYKIINGVTYWQCVRCKDWFESDNFYKHHQSKSGIKSECKKCHGLTSMETCDIDNTRRINREHMGRARAKDIEKFKERERNNPPASPEKVCARSVLNMAIKSGKIIKPQYCTVCGTGRRINGHHPNYDKPLEVEWLCPLCHAKRHRKKGIKKGHHRRVCRI